MTAVTAPAASGSGRPSASGGSGRYAALVVRLRWWICAAWLLVLVVLTVLAGRASTEDNDLGSIIPFDSPAIAAERRALQHFGFPLSSRTVVVQRDADGLSPTVQARSVLAAVSVDRQRPAPPLLGALPISNSVPIGSLSGETGTTVLTYLFMDPTSSFASQQRAARDYIDDHLGRPEDHVVGVAGSVPARAEQARLVEAQLGRLEILTIVAIFVVVGLAFRSVLAPVLALAASAVAFLTTVRLATVLGDVLGIAAPAELEPLLVALLLGVVTDYTIFYVSAVRSNLAGGQDFRGSLEQAVAEYTPIVTAAGVTVAAGTASLLAARSAFFRGFGPAMALAVLVGLVVAVTLIPALMAVIGPRLLWPRPPVPQVQVTTSVLPVRRPRTIDRLTTRRTAALVLVGTALVLLVASLPLRDVQLGVGFTTSLPADNPVARATEAASRGFAPGITSPTTLLVEGTGVTRDRSALARFQRLVESRPGVAAVIGPAQNPTPREVGVVLARSGDAARMVVVLAHEPLEGRAIHDLTALAQRLPDLAARAGLDPATRISVAGDTALAASLVSGTRRDLVRIAAAALLVNLLILIAFLRALVAPLYLLASSVLALTASLGATVAVFLGVLANESLTFYVPFAAAVLLVALGSDYNIFGVGYVWERARREPLRTAIRVALPRSTRAIATAGITLALSFGMLATIPLRPFRQLAFAMSIGILVDVLVVRSLLVPSLLTLVGPASAWPSHRLHEQAPGACVVAPPRAVVRGGTGADEKEARDGGPDR